MDLPSRIPKGYSDQRVVVGIAANRTLGDAVVWESFVSQKGVTGQRTHLPVVTQVKTHRFRSVHTGLGFTCQRSCNYQSLTAARCWSVVNIRQTVGVLLSEVLVVKRLVIDQVIKVGV